MKRIAVLFFLLPAAYLFGQEMGPPPEGPPMNREVGRQLEQIKIWQMTKDMDLPMGKAEKFFPLYNNYDSQLRNIAMERRGAVRALDSLLKENAEDPELKKQVQQILNLDAQLAEEHAKFMQSLEGVLSPIEVAKYIVFEQKFEREIRERVRMIMQQRMRERGY
ncbi:MAG TPA: hypothetical protein VLX91_00195 [Candidatus Acidoferrales bacterium]|nr:hypothetical protein [Candidatus Acidoferrales bacterium]